MIFCFVLFWKKFTGNLSKILFLFYKPLSKNLLKFDIISLLVYYFQKFRILFCKFWYINRNQKKKFSDNSTYFFMCRIQFLETFRINKGIES